MSSLAHAIPDEPTVEWGPDLVAESLFRDYSQYPVAVKEIEVAQIDYDMSRANQARLTHRFSADQADQYAIQMLDGDVFPMMVAFPVGANRYRLAGGLHRLHALREIGAKTARVYIVTCDNEADREAMTKALNFGHGRNISREDQIEMALTWMEKHDATYEEAARKMQLNPNTLSSEVRYRQARSRIARLGVNTTTLLRGVIRQLNFISNDNVLKEMARFQAVRRMPEDEVRTWVQQVNAQRTEAAQMEVVRAKINAPITVRPANKTVTRLSPEQRAFSELRRSINAIGSLLNARGSRAELGIPDNRTYEWVLSTMEAYVSRIRELRA